MALYYDLDLNSLVITPGLQSQVTSVNFKFLTQPQIDLYFVKGGVIYDIGSPPTVYFCIKPTGDYSGNDALVLHTLFTKNTDTNGNPRWTGYPSFDTAALRAAFVSAATPPTDIPLITANGEVGFVNANGLSASLDFTASIQNTVYRGTEAATALNAGFWQLVAQAPSITSFAGTTNSALAAIATANGSMTIGNVVGVTVGGVFGFYQLQAGTAETNWPTVGQPNDYNATTNAVNWVLVGPAVGGISSVPGLSAALSANAASIASEAARAIAAESQLAASRAPRQGLIFDNTAAAKTNFTAFGTGDFSVFALIQKRAAVDSIACWGGTGAFGMVARGALITTSVSNISQSSQWNYTPPSGFFWMGYVRSSAQGLGYLNNAALGSPVGDANDYSGPISDIGISGNCPSALAAFYAYNRALSADEVTALVNGQPPQSGLLISLDPAQPGVGPVWRDVSGNKADVVLPGDGVSGGVSWSLPSGEPFTVRVPLATGYAWGVGNACIPAGYVLSEAWAGATAAGTLSLGGSASDTTSLINAQTLTVSAPISLTGYTSTANALFLSGTGLAGDLYLTFRPAQ